MKLVHKCWVQEDRYKERSQTNQFAFSENGLRSWRIFLSLYKSIDKFPKFLKFKNASILY